MADDKTKAERDQERLYGKKKVASAQEGRPEPESRDTPSRKMKDFIERKRDEDEKDKPDAKKPSVTDDTDTA